jgi:serine protease inhibitor
MLAEKCQKHKASYNKALDAAYAIVHVETMKLKEQFGANSKQYYMEEIMQLSWGRKNRRSINNWNVYLRNEVKCLNDGKLIFLSAA